MMISKFNKWLIAITIVVIAGTAFHFYRNRHLEQPKPPAAEVVFSKPEEKPTTTPNPADPVKIPSSLLIKVPFTPQAPTANWDELHNEACEEASSIMANVYFADNSELTPEAVEAQITKLSQWQDKNQGYHLDQTTAEAAKMIEAVYGLKTKIIPLDKTAIKEALASNNLVLISFNGQLLKNPHYKQPGPIHHMLVMTGWIDDDTFTTNDSGTKFGLSYQYDYKVLYDAAADWDHNRDTVDTSKKFAIIVSKN